MKPEFSLNLLMVGVGGQGTVMASDILSNAALAEGFDVKKSDALGMSQRGGSVVSHVRLGRRVFSPLVRTGEAHIILGFEKLESARWASHLRPDGLAIVNNQAIPPFSVSSGAEKYPSDETILGLLNRRTLRVYLAQGVEMAQQAGNPKALNAAMLGFLSIFLDVIKRETWADCLAEALPPKLLDLNLEAFEIGRKAALVAQSLPPSNTINR